MLLFISLFIFPSHVEAGNVKNDNEINLKMDVSSIDSDFFNSMVNVFNKPSFLCVENEETGEVDFLRFFRQFSNVDFINSFQENQISVTSFNLNFLEKEGTLPRIEILIDEFENISRQFRKQGKKLNFYYI